MKVKSIRFGEIEISEDDVIRFPEGLVGLSDHNQFIMIRDPESADLIWLQSADHEAFALATIHAVKVGPDYRVEIHPQDIAALKLTELSDAEVFVIINRVDGKFYANLQGPIIVNASQMLGRQVVLINPAYGVRHSLSAAPSDAAANPA